MNSTIKSSPILFFPFNNNDEKCNHCENKYTVTPLFKQKYCKNCLSKYIEEINGSDQLDVYMNTKNSKAEKLFCTQNTKEEWYREFTSKILYFKQIITDDSFNSISIKELNEVIIENEKDCKLCGKSIKQIFLNEYINFKLCSNCYQISFGWVESGLTKKSILVLYLPWWDTCGRCVVCKLDLKYISDCLKWCSHCYLIFTGCRYCLTTNIIFGITNQSQCKKCERNLSITIDVNNINSESTDIEEFLISSRLNINTNNIVDCINKIDENENSNPLDKYSIIKNEVRNTFLKPIMEWIPYSHIKDFKKIAEGGFGIIYKAIWVNARSPYDDFLSLRNKDKIVAIKRFLDSRDINGSFLNELNSLHQCYNTDRIIKYYGITKDPETKDYMLIMTYADGGNLHSYLQENFKSITWRKKLYVLWQISDGLHIIHEKNFIHRDFHSGNILLEIKSVGRWQIADLGLSQPANNTLFNNEIYGVIPYIAPEIFKGGSFTKESDIYSMGMIMWELTTGCKPFSNAEHDHILIYQIICGKRPEITYDTPECLTELIKNCWNSDPLKRPSITNIVKIIYNWSFMEESSEEFNLAEEKRIESINSKKLGPEFAEKPHPKAIYSSRPLRSLISKSLSINVSFKELGSEFAEKPHPIFTSRPLRSLFSKYLPFSTSFRDYISSEYDLDIDIQSSNSNPPISQNTLTVPHSSAIYNSRPINTLNSAATSSRKRNIKELNIETSDNNNGRNIKTDNDLEHKK